MLYILTGSIQSGKTRWLQEVVKRLEESSVRCEGVLAPGIWSEANGEFQKEGILNELLPLHEMITFALRPNESKGIVANINCSSNPTPQSGWYIDESAVQKVNRHFLKLEDDFNHSGDDQTTILIIDELGVLELLRNEGIKQALKLLEKGPQNHYKHAIVVARAKKDLPKIVEERFSGCWGDSEVIDPHEITPEEFITTYL